MFWNTDEPHGLPHDPFKSCVIPRPIGWISSLSADGVPNLAPYSFFNGVAGDPPMVMFSSGTRDVDNPKDTIANVEQTGEFVCSMVTYDMREVMNDTSAYLEPDIDEAAFAGIEMEPSVLVKPQRVKAAPIHLECTYYQTMELPAEKSGRGNALCVGRVVGIHIRDEVMKDGMIDVSSFRAIARLGYMDYTAVDEIFTIRRPRKDAAE